MGRRVREEDGWWVRGRWFEGGQWGGVLRAGNGVEEGIASLI